MTRNNPPPGPSQLPAFRHSTWRRLLQGLLAGLLVVNILFFSLALKPAGARTRDQAEMFRRLRHDLESSRQTADRIQKIPADLGEARQQGLQFYQDKFLQLTRNPGAATKPTGFSILMEELDKLARANRVHKGAVSYSLNEVLGRPELNQVDVTTVLEGDYANIVQFVNQVERSGLFMIIDNISLVGGNPGVKRGASQARSVRLSLRLVTFFRV